MKAKNALKVFYYALVLFGLSSCTVAEEYDVFHRDGKTYITSLKVRSGASTSNNLGTRTFFDTGTNFGAVYWEDGTKNGEWKGLETGEEIYGPDCLYFFEKNSTEYKISEFYCAEQTEKYSFGDYDYDNYQWATFNLQKGSNPLQVSTTDDPHSYFGYYYPLLRTNSPNNEFTCQIHSQLGQGDKVLREFLRRNDVLRLEPFTESTKKSGTHNDQQKDGVIGILDVDEKDQDQGILTIEGEKGTPKIPDIYFDHLFALVEVELHSDTIFSIRKEGNPDIDYSNAYSIRDGSNFPYHRSSADDDGGTDWTGGYPSCWPLSTVQLSGTNSAGNPNVFVTSFVFKSKKEESAVADDYGRWSHKGSTTWVRCERSDSTHYISIAKEGTVLNYYFLVRQVNTISQLKVTIISPKFTPEGEVAEQGNYERSLVFSFNDNFYFKPGNYYKIVIDVGIPKEFKDERDDIDWQNTKYIMLSPNEEMDLTSWGITKAEEKFN